MSERPPKDSSKNEWLRGIKHTARNWWRQGKILSGPWTFMVVVFGVAIGYFTWVESRVRSIVKHPDFVNEVARRTAPAMVFDSDGRLLADMGAFAFLEGVPEVKVATPGPHDTRIMIHPKGVLRAEPILQALDDGFVSVTAKRIQGISWEVIVTPRAMLLSTEESPKNLAPPRFRLEIVPP